MSQPRRWIPLMVALTMAMAVVTGCYLLSRHQNASLQRAMQFGNLLVQRSLVSDLETRATALKRLADRWRILGGTSRFAWDADVANLLDDQPGYQAIQWADDSLRIRWIAPQLDNEKSQDMDLSRVETVASAAQRARETNEMVWTPLIELVQGGTGFVAFQPVSRNNEPDGLMMAVFNIDTWLASVIPVEGALYMGIRIRLSDETIFDSYENVPLDESILPSQWLASQQINQYGLSWTVDTWPMPGHIAYETKNILKVALAAGLFLSALAGWMIRNRFVSSERERQVSSLMENIPGVAYRTWYRSREPIVFISDACQELSGYTKSEFEHYQIRWLDLIHPDDSADREHAIEKSLEDNQTFSVEYRFTHRDGCERWVWEKGRAVQKAVAREKEPAILLEGLIIDITDRKEAELALIEAESYLISVLDTAVEAVISFDTHGRVNRINHAAEQIFGYCKSDIIGSGIEQLVPEFRSNTHGTEGADCRQVIKPYMQNAANESTAQRANQDIFPIQMVISEISIHNEPHFVALIRDVSTQRAAEHELLQSREQLVYLDRLYTLGEMASGIAHEINQPLSAISMYAQFGLKYLDAKVQKPEKLKDMLHKLSAQAHRAGAVIERVQELSRKQGSVRETIDSNKLIASMTDLAKAEALVHDMDIVLELSDASKPVSVERIQIQQVILNLVRNGLTLMEHCGKSHGNSLIIRTNIDKEMVTYSFVDSGTGVTDEMADQLYEPLSTAGLARNGIGLSLSRSIVNNHGGQLDFTNNATFGSMFYFTLPIAPGDSS